MFYRHSCSVSAVFIVCSNCTVSVQVHRKRVCTEDHQQGQVQRKGLTLTYFSCFHCFPFLGVKCLQTHAHTRKAGSYVTVPFHTPQDCLRVSLIPLSNTVRLGWKCLIHHITQIIFTLTHRQWHTLNHTLLTPDSINNAASFYWHNGSVCKSCVGNPEGYSNILAWIICLGLFPGAPHRE